MSQTEKLWLAQRIHQPQQVNATNPESLIIRSYIWIFGVSEHDARACKSHTAPLRLL